MRRGTRPHSDLRLERRAVLCREGVESRPAQGESRLRREDAGAGESSYSGRERRAARVVAITAATISKIATGKRTSVPIQTSSPAAPHPRSSMQLLPASRPSVISKHGEPGDPRGDGQAARAHLSETYPRPPTVERPSGTLGRCPSERSGLSPSRCVKIVRLMASLSTSDPSRGWLGTSVGADGDVLTRGGQGGRRRATRSAFCQA